MSVPAIVSWSSGKDSAFALWTVRREGRFRPVALLTTVTEGYDRVSMHGVREALLDRQTAAIGLPVVKVRIPPDCPNETYEARMGDALASPPVADVDHIVFADLFLADVRAYREERLTAAGKTGVFPLWGRHTGELARDIVSAGVEAVAVCVDPRAVDPSFAGRRYDARFLDDLPDGVDPCGERGEFHTFVFDGPGFSAPVGWTLGERVTRDGFVFQDLT